MSEPSRIEKMVGTVLGLRLLVTQLVAAAAARSGDDAAFNAALRNAALAALETWPIGSDTPEGADNIRRCAVAMLSEFPKPTKIS